MNTKIPAPILANILKVALCCGCMAVGGTAWAIASNDRILLFLSATIAVIGIVKAVALHKMSREAAYEVLEGTVTAVHRSMAQKRTIIVVVRTDGTERTLQLSGKVFAEQGGVYRFYLTKLCDIENWNAPAYLMPTQSLLGLERMEQNSER